MTNQKTSDRENKAVVEAVRQSSGLDKRDTDILCRIVSDFFTSIHQNLPEMLNRMRANSDPSKHFVVKGTIARVPDTNGETDTFVVFQEILRQPPRQKYGGRVNWSDQGQLF